ncbi:MAG: hypothetical protein KDA92_13080 [Planctomycetales bacterium]|nr:hypothetical protein [Planctomycetales bacterium]MCA9166211.1 hypothetical protein [Planctomycetales bacterium]
MLNRRDALRILSTTPVAYWSLATGQASCLWSDDRDSSPLYLATFRFDVTPPVGHSCCGGWIKPVEQIDDALEAIGFVLIGRGRPIVVCSVDWTGLLNRAHYRWREALATAAGTTVERVAVHCVHQHNAPFACLDAEQIVSAQGDLPHIVDTEFFSQCLTRGTEAVTQAIKSKVPVTHVATGQAVVERVASNRRVNRDAQGHVVSMRGSSCQDEALRALPEGLIDPQLKTVSLFSGSDKVLSCHYYATHPMSYYADGRVTSDFAGLARKRRQQDEPTCAHIYFTGCSGNIAAGKYNDGSPAARQQLTDRLYAGLVASEANLTPRPLSNVQWRTTELTATANPVFERAALQSLIDDKQNTVVTRNRSAFTAAWLDRLTAGTPLQLSSLRFDDITLLHLPAECFIEYQLRAQAAAPDRFVATAAYGDGGPWYIPTATEYPHGGYEVSVAFSADSIDGLLAKAIEALV